MSLIDFILNMAGLLLWLNWRAAERPLRLRWYYLAGLPALLIGRALFYWQAGAPLHWAPGIRLSALWLAFRSDFPGRMFLYSFISFGVSLGFFYLCLLLLSAVNGSSAEGDPSQRWVRGHLGRLDRWPTVIKLLLPLVVMTALWCSLNPLLLGIDMVPKVPTWRLLAQGALIGLSGYLTLKFFVLGLLAVYVVNSYIYLGESTFLKFVNTTSNGLLLPLRKLPLRIGRVDLAPLAGMALVIVAAEFGRCGLDQLYH